VVPRQSVRATVRTKAFDQDMKSARQGPISYVMECRNNTCTCYLRIEGLLFCTHMHSCLVPCAGSMIASMLVGSQVLSTPWSRKSPCRPRQLCND
jgi:hypothetical protein